MNYSIIGLAAILSFSAAAAEKCTIVEYTQYSLRLGGSTYKPGSINDSKQGTQYTFVESWQACYKKAVELSKKRPMTATYTFRDGPIWKDKTYDVVVPLYFKWIYDDGVILKTSGYVTSNSPVDNPMPGNRRIDSDGMFF